MIPDYTLGDTLDFKFTTRAFATGAPTTLSGTPVVSAYPDNSTTQLTAGITLSADFDSVTGLNNVRVVASSGNGYASGSTYHLVITTGTVDSVSVVGEVVGAFSLGRSAAAADLANGTDGLGAIKAETAAILADTGTTLDNLVDDLESRLGTPSDLGGGASVAANLSDIEALVDNLESRLGTPSDLGGGATVAANLSDIKTETASILTDTGTTLDNLVDDLESRLGTPSDLGSGASIAANLVDIEAQTDDIGVAGAGLTNINLPDQTMNITGNITGNLSGSVGSVTGNVGGNVTGSVGSLATQAKADVNAEVVDALNTDTYAEPGQGAPAATATLVAKIGYLYKAWRNKSDQSADTYQLYADDATTVDQKATVSDDGSTATKGEVTTGA